ncbi:MAG: hypothetical protein Q9160_008760 [Pyrenula sp. 1 TL-2023]
MAPTGTLQSDGLTNTVSVGRLPIVTQIQHISAEIYENSLATQDCFYKLPFEITISGHSIEVPEGVPEAFSHLPPSFGRGALYYQPKSESVFMQPLIMYTLDAEVRTPGISTSGIAISSRVSREVPLIPIRPASPPLDIKDFPREYQLKLARNLRKRFRYRPLGTIEVSTSEPQPLNLASRYPRPFTTVPIQLSFTELTRYKKIPAHPCNWKLCIRTTIISKTFYSVLPLFKYGQPTTRLAKVSSTMSLNVSHESDELRSPRDTFWSLTHKDGHAIWTAGINVPVHVPKRIPPTFLSALAGRRYSVRVEIDVVNLSHFPLVLETPLQVIFNPQDRTEEHGEEQSSSEASSVSEPPGACAEDDFLNTGSPPPEYYRRC